MSRRRECVTEEMKILVAQYIVIIILLDKAEIAFDLL